MDPDNNISFTIETAPWNEQNITAQFDIISTTHSGSGTYNSENKTLSFDKDMAEATLTFSTMYKDHTTFTATISNDASEWLTATFADKVLSVKATQNTTSSSRTGYITTNSDVDPNVKLVITVTQRGA